MKGRSGLKIAYLVNTQHAIFERQLMQRVFNCTTNKLQPMKLKSQHMSHLSFIMVTNIASQEGKQIKHCPCVHHIP
jgi:hypothetical protein